jgi:aspartate aminotransferase
MELSQRMQTLEPSITLAITAKAKQMQAEGIDVIGFGAGEPDFGTPDNISRAGKEAIDKGFTRYTAAAGIIDLRKAICDKQQRDNGLTYKSDEIVITCGAKHGLYCLFQAIVNPGDEVIIPAPYWVSYPEQVKLAGGKPVLVSTREEDNFLLTPEAFALAITPRTRAVIINSPSNPTGCIYSREKLVALARVAKERHVLVISDEIYEKFVYTPEPPVSIATLPDMQAHTIVVNGVSKTYAMTGWRIGYIAGPANIVKAIADLQSQSTSNPDSIAQKASLEAYSGPQSSVELMRGEFLKRRDIVCRLLGKIPGITCMVPEGAFYVFPNVKALLGKKYKGQVIENTSQLTSMMLDSVKVAAVPGSGFGAEGYLRLSYAISLEEIEEGCRRIAAFVDELTD